MTEADEVAAVLLPEWNLLIDPNLGYTTAAARQWVRSKMPGESQQVIENVTESLIRQCGIKPLR